MSQGTKFLDRVNGPMHGKQNGQVRGVKDATHCQPVSRSALALSCAAVAARWASSISVRDGRGAGQAAVKASADPLQHDARRVIGMQPSATAGSEPTSSPPSPHATAAGTAR